MLLEERLFYNIPLVFHGLTPPLSSLHKTHYIKIMNYLTINNGKGGTMPKNNQSINNSKEWRDSREEESVFTLIDPIPYKLEGRQCYRVRIYSVEDQELISTGDMNDPEECCREYYDSIPSINGKEQKWFYCGPTQDPLVHLYARKEERDKIKELTTRGKHAAVK